MTCGWGVTAMPGDHRPEEIERRLRSARYVDREIAGIERANGLPPSRRWLPTLKHVLIALAAALVMIGACLAGAMLGQMAGAPARGAEWQPPTTYGAPGPTGGPTR